MSVAKRKALEAFEVAPPLCTAVASVDYDLARLSLLSKLRGEDGLSAAGVEAV